MATGTRQAAPGHIRVVVQDPLRKGLETSCGASPSLSRIYPARLDPPSQKFFGTPSLTRLMANRSLSCNASSPFARRGGTLGGPEKPRSPTTPPARDARGLRRVLGG